MHVKDQTLRDDLRRADSFFLRYAAISKQDPCFTQPPARWVTTGATGETGEASSCSPGPVHLPGCFLGLKPSASRSQHGQESGG